MCTVLDLLLQCVSSRLAASQLQKSLSEEQANSHSLQLQLHQLKSSSSSSSGGQTHTDTHTPPRPQVLVGACCMGTTIGTYIRTVQCDNVCIHVCIFVGRSYATDMHERWLLGIAPAIAVPSGRARANGTRASAHVTSQRTTSERKLFLCQTSTATVLFGRTVLTGNFTSM